MPKPTIGQPDWGGVLNDHLDNLAATKASVASVDALTTEVATKQPAATLDADVAAKVNAAATAMRTAVDGRVSARVSADAGASGTTIGDALASKYVSVTEAPLNARRYGAVNDGVTNDAAAYQAAVNALPGDINAGGGSILIDGQTVWNAPIEVIDKAGVKFESPGGFQSYISPGAAIAGTGKPLLTVKGTAAVVRGFQMENVNIDMLGVDAHAIEIAGAFDNTELRNVWVRGIHRSKSGVRLLPGPGDGISQSIILDSVQCISIDATANTGIARSAPLFYLDRVHEATFRLTKAIGVGMTVGGVGYELVDCEQVTFDLPSASNVNESFRITSTGTSGRMSTAIAIQDPYLETVAKGVVAVGANSTYPVLKVRLKDPRVSNPGGSPITSVFDGTHTRLSRVDVYDEPVLLKTGSYSNRVQCAVAAVTDTSGTTWNTVITDPNGLGNGYDINGLVRVGGYGLPAGVDQTGLWLAFWPYGGALEWRRAKAGAPDSGGVGFRTLVIPN